MAGWYRSKIASADALEAGINSLGTSIGRAIEESRLNNTANQIGSQEANSGAYAPRAALVAPGENPDLPGTSNYIPSSVPTGGTAPATFTGGYRGLQLQTAIDSLRRQNANTASEIALRQKQGEYYGAHSDYLGQQIDINRQRANAYQQSVNQKTNPQVSAQQFAKSAKDLLPQGISQGWINVLSGNLPFSRGDVDENGAWKASPTGSKYSFGDTPEDLATNAAPVDTIEQLDQQLAKMRAGGGGNQPSPGGDNGNLPTLTPQQARAMPSGTRFQGTDGQTYTVP